MLFKLTQIEQDFKLVRAKDKFTFIRQLTN